MVPSAALIPSLLAVSSGGGCGRSAASALVSKGMFLVPISALLGRTRLLPGDAVLGSPKSIVVGVRGALPSPVSAGVGGNITAVGA